MPTRPLDRSRRSLLLALVLACASCSRDERMNVVLVTLDTTRADYLGAYGKPGCPTPNLDGLAAEGTRFDLAISTAALTPVSHASILTGLDNKDHGLRVLSAQSGFRLPSGVPTLATVLHAKGYHTVAVHSAFPVSSYFGFQRDFDVFESVEGQMGRLRGNAARRTWDIARFQRRSDETTDLALASLEKTSRPFFLWIHYWDPHDDVLLPPPELLPANLRRTGADGQPQPSLELYGTEVSYVDAQLGRLIAALRASGQYEHTLFVVVADHGEGLGDHGWDHHRILYQEQIRVPLIVRVPGAKQAAAVSDLVRTTDIFPTVLDYLGIPAPKPVSGASLRGLVEGRPEAPRLAFADQINGYDWNASMVDTHPQFDFLYCAMDREWKLIYRPTRPEASELYEIARDPRELKNVLRERPKEALRLERELARHGGWVTAPFGKEAGAPDPRTAEHALESLGYAGGGSQETAPGPQWAWTCPEHASVKQDARGACPTCGTPLIPVRREP